MSVEFACIITHEIFEKDKITEINNSILSNFGQPLIIQRKSGNTSKDGKSIWILENKYVWKIDNVRVFLDFLKKEKTNLPNDFDDTFNSKIETAYIVGLWCEELPYYQVVVYAEIAHNSEIPIHYANSLVVPFQKYLEGFNGFSLTVYENSKIKPRFYAHFVVNSPDNYRLGTAQVTKLYSLQKENNEYKIVTSDQSKAIRALPFLNQFGLPTVLSAVNYSGGMLSFVTHLEVFGGGGELQGCGITFAQLPQVAIPEFQTQGIEKEIAMFCPNINIFFSVFGGINMHLFLVGLTTWISYVEKIVDQLVLEMGNERQHIQKLLNENQLDRIEERRDSFAKIQGNIASIGILLAETRMHVFEWLDEILQRDWLTGEGEVPIPQIGHNLIFEKTLTSRVGDSTYFQLLTSMLKNRFETMANKLELSSAPTSQLIDFIYSQTEYKLSKAIKKNSWIEIIVAIVVGLFTFVAILPFLGIKPPL